MSTETVDLVETSDTFVDAEEMETSLGVPTIGHIPMIDEEKHRLIKDLSHFSPTMESYRSLRANIRFLMDKPLRSLLVTSSVPAEGKSTVTANLAMSMAAALELDGKTVILVDADLRRPSQHRIFNAQSKPGLTEVLRGTHTIAEVLQPTVISNLSVIFAGEAPTNPTELLESAAMGRFMADMEKLCETVIFDSPPTLAVADSAVVASKTDATLVVVGYGETKKPGIKMTVKLLNRARATVLGTIFNRLPGPLGGYYYGTSYVHGDPNAVATELAAE